MKHTKESIIELLRTNDDAVGRALVALNEKQTDSEQTQERTIVHNLQGFMVDHAERGTSMANYYKRNGFLTQKQLAFWRKETPSGRMRIAIYAAQLLKIAKEKKKKKADRLARAERMDLT